MTERFAMTWEDGGREPQCAPDPRFPNGVDLNYSKPNQKSCCVKLPPSISFIEK